MIKLAYNPFIIFIITIITIVFFISLDKSGQKTNISNQNIAILEAKVYQMSSDVIETEKKIAETESDIFKEKIIRNELLLQKPGEHIIQIPDMENLAELNSINLNDNKPINEWLELLR